MRALVQRVSSAEVVVDDRVSGAIDDGLLVLLGVMEGDTADDLDYLAAKCANLRIFGDDEGKMNRSVRETGGGILVVSQFTLAAETRKGNRPSFISAAPPDQARVEVDRFCERLRSFGIPVETGVFGAAMSVALTNEGPVTIWMDSRDRAQPRR